MSATNNMNEDQLKAILARNPSITVTEHNFRDCNSIPSGTTDHGQVSTKEPERREADALASVAERETKSVGCPRISFTFYRCRLVDVDALNPKDLLDGLVKACLIPDDKEGAIILEPPRQEKVAHKTEERTGIIIKYI